MEPMALPQVHTGLPGMRDNIYFCNPLLLIVSVNQMKANSSWSDA